jgi:hypothetical protein
MSSVWEILKQRRVAVSSLGQKARGHLFQHIFVLLISTNRESSAAWKKARSAAAVAAHLLFERLVAGEDHFQRAILGFDLLMELVASHRQSVLRLYLLAAPAREVAGRPVSNFGPPCLLRMTVVLSIVGRGPVQAACGAARGALPAFRRGRGTVVWRARAGRRVVTCPLGLRPQPLAGGEAGDQGRRRHRARQGDSERV